MPYVRAALAACALCATPAMAADVITQVGDSARQTLVEQATRNGLVEPKVELTVQTATRTGRTCAQPLRVEALDTRYVTRMRFAAICEAGNWREEFVVHGELSALVVVAAGAINAGRPIDAADLRLERHSLAAPDEGLSVIDEVAGQASRRALRPGQAVERRMLVEAVLVKRGAAVRIVARNEGIVVTTAGQAAEAGRRDDVISVRNAVTGKLIRARVTGIDEVEPADVPKTQSPD
jgi:flagella basal body P-ring formation protein FlgA